MTGSCLWGAVIFYCKCCVSLIGDCPLVVSVKKFFFGVVFDKRPVRISHQAFVAVFKGTLKADQNIWLSVIGLSLFWGVSQIIVAAFPAHYKAMFNEDNAVVIQAILAVSGVGLVLGSYLAGRASRLHIELGIVPLGPR